MKRLVCLLFILGCVSAALPITTDRIKWEMLPSFSGGLNIDKQAVNVSQNQLTSVSNFLWDENKQAVVVREGFSRYLAPISPYPLRFMSIFKRSNGTRYLIKSDGYQVWYNSSLTDTSVVLTFGNVTAGKLRTTSSDWVRAVDTLPALRTLLGTGEGIPITLSGKPVHIERIILDTLMQIDTTWGANYDSVSYSFGGRSVDIRSITNMIDKSYIFTSNGYGTFSNPDTFACSGAIRNPRTRMTNVENYGLGNKQLKWTLVGGLPNVARYLQMVSDPKARTTVGADDTLPIASGHHYYMSYPITQYLNDGAYTLGAAFMPDTVGSGAHELVTIVDLSYDPTTLEYVLCDSVQMGKKTLAGGKAGYQVLYLHDAPDSMKYATGDYFLTPSRTSAGVTWATGGMSLSHVDYPAEGVMIGGKFTTPANVPAIKGVQAVLPYFTRESGSTPAMAAVYRASDSTLIATSDTTTMVTHAYSSAPYYYTGFQPAFARFNFDSVGLLSNTTYFLVVSCDRLISLQAYYGSSDGNYFKTDAYDGTFPVKWEPDSRDSYFSGMTFSVTYFDSSYAGHRTYGSCYPIAGGYVKNSNTIFAASPDTIGFHDHDTTIVKIFRMRNVPSPLPGDGSAYSFTAEFQDRIFYATDNEPTILKCSDPFLPTTPDTSIHVNLTRSDGDILTAAAQQGANLTVYSKNSRWGVFSGEVAGTLADGTSTTEVDYARELLLGNVGCVSSRALVVVDGIHYFLHTTGMYRTTGAQGKPEPIDYGTVNSFFRDSINTTAYDKVAMGYDPSSSNLWISFPRKGTLVNNITLVYSINTGAWWQQSFHASSYAFNQDVSISDSVTMLVGGTDSSTVFYRAGVLDDTTTITASLRTPWLDWGEPQQMKRISAVIAPSESKELAALTVRADMSPLDTSKHKSISIDIPALTNSQAIGYFPLGSVNGYSLRFTLSLIGHSGFSLSGLWIQEMLKGGTRR
jgi:hypothetical protein